MAIFTKELFDNPYIDIGKNSDICVLCRKEYLREHRDEYDYRADEALRGQLLDKRIFKIFQNSNMPFVLCEKHIHEIDGILREDS